MLTMHPEYVVDESSHKKAVLLPWQEWEALMEDLEELDDIRAYDEAIAQPEKAIPFEQAVKEIEKGDQH
ncbi:MAG: hypothetical protein NTX50_26625 [Candidatus Sumerlaeota bacterium]|nr:hypothetical protein [Candidatus Sumerlaeota bacterium]